MATEPTLSTSESENPAIPSPKPETSHRPRTNRDWWPNQPDLQVLNRTVRQNLAHAVHEVLPILRAMKVVHHQKTTLRQVVPQPLRLLVSERPPLHLNRVDPRIVEYLIGV